MANTLAELVQKQAVQQPSLPLYRFLLDGEEDCKTLSCAELHESSLAIAAQLVQKCIPGDRVLLLAPPGLDFIRGFFAIHYAGLIATTSYAPHPRRVDRTLHRLQSIVASCEPKVALVTEGLCSVAQGLGLTTVEIGVTQSDFEPLASPVPCEPDATAFLQYTSGSTANPRGVILTHSMVMDNLRFIAERFEHSKNSVGVIWLPPYHDMGLIGGILQPLYAGFPVVLLNPLHVLQRPARWLAAMTKYGGTTSGGPNFIFDHCVDSISPQDRSQFDLRSWEVAFCGAETVRPATWRRFAQAFSGCGFREEAFFPCYGLAEATLMVTGSKRLSKPNILTRETSSTDPASSASKRLTQEYISCGTPDAHHQLRIVEAHSDSPNAVAEDGKVGEIWVCGPSLSKGYWNEPEVTQATFQSHSENSPTWLRTGDLGFIEERNLYLTGRLKELIILAGRNLYPQDLEVAIEAAHPMLLANGACAFSVDKDHREKLIVLAEVRPNIRKMTDEEKRDCVQAIRKALGGQFDVQFNELWLVRAGSIPRTSSGKKKRGQARSLFEQGFFQKEDVAVADAGVSHRDRGIHAASSTTSRLQKRLALAMVIVPIVGLVAAIFLSWGYGVQWGDLVWLAGLYIATVFGVEVGFHRHFSHRSFQASPAVRTALGVLGSMAAQGPLLFWVATHRRHHAFSDQADDPHSPSSATQGWLGKLQGLWHAHVGWLFRSEVTNPMQYAPDVFRDPLSFRLSQSYPVWVMLGLAIPAIGNWAITGTTLGLLRGFLWGGLVRVLLVHHATWSVNSICHTFGQRAFETRDDSRNNGWLALSSLGGSWHNNHHAFPNSAITGFRFWQFDPSGWLIALLGKAGLVWDIKKPNKLDRARSTLPITHELREG